MTSPLKGAVRLLCLCTLGLALALLLAFLHYDITEFQSRRVDIAMIVASAHPDERNPPVALRRLLLAEHSGDLSLAVARLLMVKLDVPEAWRRGWRWQTHNVLWWLLVRLHLSRDDQLAIFCSTPYLGRRVVGFEAAAQHYFRAPLSSLDENQLADLVRVAHAPARARTRIDPHLSPGQHAGQ